ncbi:hypothetical protein [Brevibacterium aurantiacum]|uniref:Uncharacterized protein n=1 Tax=Brevibacterium aurantiacum TaxID=273384 RepID=A0A556C4V9_BREAU|nr:hypothetical protein [Brevibacterium aurantiacum]TSI12462.1 hypothetical protein FO013_20235 [Brevibacterium aurantiacum]
MTDELPDFSGFKVDKLGEDKERTQGSSDLADAVADGLTQKNTQQKSIFTLVKWLVCISFGVMILFVVLFGLGWLNLSKSGEVAAIAAVGVQPFILIGILTSSVYKSQPFGGSNEPGPIE